MIMYIAICDDEINDLNYEKELIQKELPSVMSDIKWEIDTFLSSKDMLESRKPII